jgi:mRNA-degrading endonuclease YafQ of YafQ-DinJ toxin-antitoxin module
LQIDLSKPFRDGVRGFDKRRRRDIARVIDSVRDGFGTPHLHSGLGVRRLRRNYFECRAGLQIRLIFRAERGLLYFVTLGNHDEIQRFLKTL